MLCTKEEYKEHAKYTPNSHDWWSWKQLWNEVEKCMHKSLDRKRWEYLHGENKNNYRRRYKFLKKKRFIEDAVSELIQRQERSNWPLWWSEFIVWIFGDSIERRNK
jgi:hypothetical protein